MSYTGNGPAQELSHTEISPAPSDVTMNIVSCT